MPLPPELGGELTEDGHIEADGRDDPHLVEEACLAYVALTRARDELVLSHAERYGRGSTRYPPSPFLAPILRGLGAAVAREQWEADLPGADLEGEDDEGVKTAGGERAGAEPLSLPEIEAYLRCPRRYAYQYVDDLRGREAEFTALRRALRATLHALRPPAAAEADIEPVSALEQANALFERHWAEARDAAPDEGHDAATRMALRRYGLQVIARAWTERGAAHAEGAAPSLEYDLPLTVRAGQHEIELTVDLIERSAPVEQVASGTEPGVVALPIGDIAAGARAARAPIRLVRQRVTAGEPRPDVRSLLYTLAAEQYGADGQPAEVTQRHEATGTQAPLQVSARQSARLREELAGAIEGIKAGRFPARPEPRMCAGCPFLFVCPA
jgi:hypothetical protein